jgi:STE24 endopeptidase
LLDTQVFVGILHDALRHNMRYGVMLAALLLAMLGACSIASAMSLDRPNALDRRVDALSAQMLTSEPATQLVDPARQTAAQRLVHWRLPAWVCVQVFEAVGLVYFWLSGGAATLRRFLQRHITSPWLMRFAFGASLALVARIASILPDFALYRVDRIMQLSVQLTRVWFGFWAIHTLFGMIAAGLIAAIVLGLVVRTHQWYLYTILAILAGCVIFPLLSPFARLPGPSSLQPLAGSLRTSIQLLLRRSDLPQVPISVVRIAQSPVGGAAVLGLGASRTIIISDSLIAGSTPPEIDYAVGVQLGHFIHHDMVAIALIEGGLIILFSALAVLIADRIPFRRDDDPLSRLAIVGALLALLYIAAVPARNAAIQGYDFGADRYAIALTGDRADAVRALVRSADQRMEEACPEPSARLFLYTSPGLALRVAAINGVAARCP